MKNIINSEKHYVQYSLSAITSGSVANNNLCAAVPVISKNLVFEVEEGSLVKAVYLEFWVTSDDATQGSAIWALEKVQSGTAPMNAAEIAALNSYDNKKNVLHVGMGLIPTNVDYPMNLVKGWFKIPKGKQRMGIGDELQFSILAQSNGVSYCGFSTYKEYK